MRSAGGDMTPYELLSGAEHTGNRSRDNNTYVVSKETEIGLLVEIYQILWSAPIKRIIKYNKKGSGRQYKAPSWGVSGHWRTLPDGREIHSVLQ